MIVLSTCMHRKVSVVKDRTCPLSVCTWAYFVGLLRQSHALVYVQQQLVTTGNKEQLSAYFSQQVAWNFKKSAVRSITCCPVYAGNFGGH